MKESHSPLQQKNKVPEISLPEETEDLYAGTCKTLMKAIKDDTTERYNMLLDWKNQYYESDYTTQSNLQIQCNLYQNTNGIFYRTKTKKS